MTDVGGLAQVCPDLSPCCPSLCLAAPAGAWPAWWVKPKILRIPHNITAMLQRVSAACYGRCRAWLPEGIFSFSLNAWHPRTVNRSLGRNKWNCLLTLPVMKMISQLTLLIYSILWEDKMSRGKIRLQVMSKRTSPLISTLIYGELWQVWKLLKLPFMFAFVYFSLDISDNKQISAATYNLISLTGKLSVWRDILQPQLPVLQEAEDTTLVNIFKGKMSAKKLKLATMTLQGGNKKNKSRWKKFTTWDRFN